MKIYEGQKPYVFISYAHKDFSRVKPAISVLADHGFRVWYDSGIRAGSEWPAYIEKRLNDCQVLLVFLSKAAVDSVNCRNEINYALKLRKEILVVYLEKTDLHSGLGLQLSTTQSMFLANHTSKESFHNELCAAQILQECKETASVTEVKRASHTPPPKPPQVEAKSKGEPWYRRWLVPSSYHSKRTEGKSAKYYYRRAIHGDAWAQYNYGVCCEKGTGVPRDLVESVVWYRKSAAQGFAKAQYELACYYEKGQGGLAVDLAEATKLYLLAAAQGLASAQYKMGVFYHRGIYVAVDFKEAVKWYHKAAEQGHAEAQYALGYCYQKGIGVAHPNMEEAIAWYQKSAEKGYAEAQCVLGKYYEEVTRSFDKAVTMYRSAAENGYAEAQYRLGLCYRRGVGVAQDFKQALLWFTKAASQKFAVAIYEIGRCYELGDGVEINIDQALKYYRTAADYGCFAAKNAVKRLWYRK